MTIWGLLLLAALVMKLWPETGCARWLHATLIERPLAFVSSIRRAHFIFLIVGLALMYSFAQIGMPHLAFAAAVDMSAYVDAMITVWTVAALSRARGNLTALRARLGGPVRVLRMARPRARRSAARRTAGKPSNDDEGHGGFAGAFALAA